MKTKPTRKRTAEKSAPRRGRPRGTKLGGSMHVRLHRRQEVMLRLYAANCGLTLSEALRELLDAGRLRIMA